MSESLHLQAHLYFILPLCIIYLRASRQSRLTSSGLSKVNLSSPPADETRQLDTAAKLPLGQLLRRHDVRVLASIEAGDKRGRTRVSAANVESPGHESAVLVGVQDDV